MNRMENIAKYNGFHGTKSSTICPICGNDILGSDLFCEICGMRIHSNQQLAKRNEVNRNQARLTSTNIIKPAVTRYGLHKLSEMPDLKMVIDRCKTSINTTDAIMSNLVDFYRSQILDSISDVIDGDVIDTGVFESLGINFIEERDFGLDRCTEAAKEIFNIGVIISWSKLSLQQRMEISGVYAKEVAEAFELVRYKGIVYKDFSDEGTLGENDGDGTVYLTKKYMDPSFSPLRIIDTITHELRHQYQYEAVELRVHNVPEDVVKEWGIAFQIYTLEKPCYYDPWGYFYNALEIDARYAGETVVRNISHDLFNAKSIGKKNAIDMQLLRKSLIQEGYSGLLLEQTIKNLLKLDGKAAEMLYSWLQYGIVPEFSQIEGVSSTFLREFCGMKEPAIILSYGLLMNNPVQNSKYLMNQLNKQSHQYNPKANLRSRYIFYDERDYNNAKDAIYWGNHTVYDKLYWYGDWGYVNGHDHTYRVDLYDDLTQEELEYAVGHIREHNGQYYKD